MLKCAITNKLETNGKQKASKKEAEVIKKNQRKILELKNTIMVAFNNRVKGTKERISEVKDFFKNGNYPNLKNRGKKTDLKNIWTQLFVAERMEE